MKSILKNRKFLLLIIILLFISPYLLQSVIAKSYKNNIYYNTDKITDIYAALILGASVKPDKTPSDTLLYRIEAGVELYKAGKVKKLIMSGDNRESNYNEPEVMRAAAIKLGVPKDDIQPDYAGRRTYDSCWRAKHIFNQDKIIVITQEFHIVRSVLTCNQLGMDAIGYVAKTPAYDPSYYEYLKFRETFALNKSLVDIFVKKPEVVAGDKITI